MNPSQKAFEFLSSYREAFVCKNPEAIAAHYSEPMLVYSEGNKVVFHNHQLAATEVKKLLSVYEQLGMADAVITSLSTVLREGNVEQVLANWTLYGNHKEKLVSFKTSYTLTHDASGTTCLFAISHNELAEIRKYLSRSG